MNRRRFLAAAASSSLATLPALRSASAASSPRIPLLFGVDYYPDQTPESLWAEDARQMQDFGITNVRIAEFAWSLMEPSEGHFDFAWLHRAVDLLHAHNIGVILGTPSAAPPPWLSLKYPEILLVNDHGVTLSPGARRFTCPTNATYRRLSLAVATQMARSFAAKPGVIGWQIDNELTLGSSGRCYCRFCRAGFQQWLQKRYTSLDQLNQAWGTIFWSDTYTGFAQIPVPLPSGAPPNPGHALDYDRYQSDANVSFLTEQLTRLRTLCPAHFITTNNVGLVTTINQRDLYRDLDLVAADNYPGYITVHNPDQPLPDQAVVPLTAFSLDVSRSTRDGQPFLIMEQQSGKAGQPFFSPQPHPGQLRLWAWQAVAHGAMGINFFRWDTADFGAEEYWHGILRHDRSPSPAFDELKSTLAELKALGSQALNASYPARLALCFDPVSDWALGIQPGQPKLNYMSQSIPWYAALSATQAGVDIVDATADLSHYQVLCAPAMYVVSPEQAQRIRAFVQQGGTFIAGFRLGVKDQHSRIVDTPLPGLLRDVMGVQLFDYQPLYAEPQSIRLTDPLAAGKDIPCALWADILSPAEGTEVLATYTGASYPGKAAITRHRFGKGTAIYLGAGLEGADLARLLLAMLAIPPAVQVPPGVEVTVRRDATHTWTYLLNHTSAPQTAHTSTTAVQLPPYGVRLLTA